jgi:hypothetical protein
VRGVRLVLGGTAAVFCIHDREKRSVTTERQVFELGLQAGQLYDRRIHKLMRCACCDNLFVSVSDEPRFCSSCQRPQIHVPGGPLPEPRGVIE